MTMKDFSYRGEMRNEGRVYSHFCFEWAPASLRLQGQVRKEEEASLLFFSERSSCKISPPGRVARIAEKWSGGNIYVSLN